MERGYIGASLFPNPIHTYVNKILFTKKKKDMLPPADRVKAVFGMFPDMPRPLREEPELQGHLGAQVRDGEEVPLRSFPPSYLLGSLVNSLDKTF